VNFTGTIVLLYAFAVAIGGIIGYTKVGSLPSLIMGIVFGVILVVCSYGLFKKLVWGYMGALAASSILTIFFVARFVLSGKMWPGGMMAFLSFMVMLLILSTKNFNQQT